MFNQPGDGYLHLFNNRQGDDLLLSMIRSDTLFQYGYFEARIRFQHLEGHHGAFWLQSPTYRDSPDDPAHSGAEIDIIEFFGNGRPVKAVKHGIFWKRLQWGKSRMVRIRPV